MAGQSSGDSDRVDWLDMDTVDDSDADASPAWRFRPRHALIIAAVLAVFTVGGIQHLRTQKDPAAARVASPARSSSSPPHVVSITPEPSVPPVTVTSLGHSLLTVPTSWELFGRGPNVVVRIQLALGRITRTTFPTLDSSGPVSIMVGADRAIIRPLDFVSGYVVPDGRPARPLTGTPLARATFPGPDSKHLWVSAPDGNSMQLADLNGHPTGASLPVVEGSASSDGAGYLMFQDTGGVYDARPSGVHRITTGELLATGPTQWLVAECDDVHHCSTIVIDRATGARRVIGGRRDSGYPAGVISPDGSTAALIRLNLAGGSSELHFLNLATGADRKIKAPLDPASILDSTLVWSPDSHLLFVAGDNGKLYVVEESGSVHQIAATLPPLTQLALRTN